jgi:Mg/Co/Ni transporter MgtE
MSPRAACRLDTLGFEHVHDYVPGKADWLAHGLAVEGSWNQAATAGALARRDVATCQLTETAAAVRDRIERSPYGFALVLSDQGEILLGRVRRSGLGPDPHAPVEELMEPGPSTVRAYVEAEELARRLEERKPATAVVTTPSGGLLGVVRREQLGTP